MTTKAIAAFHKDLDSLFRRRVHWLMHAVEGPKPGAPPRISRRHVSKTISRMQEHADLALANKLALTEFEGGTTQRHSWHAKRGKGRGPDRKRISFNAWLDRKFDHGPFIYVFWRRNTCLYVGKTTKSGRRILKHFEEDWFGSVTRVDVYRSRGTRVLPALECLAMHRFLPTKNKFRAERRKWTSKCSLCKVHQHIAREMRDIFNFR